MSTGDKRSVSTDALETLGTILGEGCGRDAIHLAVEPVVAGQRLDPGADVGLVDGKAVVCDKPLGIVDPFLKKTVKSGERFWLVVYPRQITSLRHVWSHPDFPEGAALVRPEDKEASEAWLRNFFGSIYCTYNSGMETMADYLKSDGSYLNFGTGDSGDLPSEFWDHIEVVTGEKVRHRIDWFSCVC